MWTLLPLGNPGEEYADTRHNLGRLMLQRWIQDRGVEVPVRHRFQAGVLYALGEGLQALVPATYMNRSGLVCAEAIRAGLDPASLVVLYDDKDLPLGLGRFRLDGSAAGHNGLASVMEQLGTDQVPRLRLGIGPFQRPLHEFVLQPWTEPEWDLIDGLDDPFARFLGMLAGTVDLGVLPGWVNAEGFWRGETKP